MAPLPWPSQLPLILVSPLVSPALVSPALVTFAACMQDATRQFLNCVYPLTVSGRDTQWQEELVLCEDPLLNFK